MFDGPDGACLIVKSYVCRGLCKGTPQTSQISLMSRPMPKTLPSHERIGPASSLRGRFVPARTSSGSPLSLRTRSRQVVATWLLLPAQLLVLLLPLLHLLWHQRAPAHEHSAGGLRPHRHLAHDWLAEPPAPAPHPHPHPEAAPAPVSSLLSPASAALPPLQALAQLASAPAPEAPVSAYRAAGAVAQVPGPGLHAEASLYHFGGAWLAGQALPSLPPSSLLAHLSITRPLVLRPRAWLLRLRARSPPSFISQSFS